MLKKVTETKPSYVVSRQCPVCNATAQNGDQLRDEIDSQYMAGDSYLSISRWCNARKVFLTARQIENHLKNHSSFLYNTKKAVSRKQQIIKKQITDQKRDADNALDRIITLGDKMVENYQKRVFEGVETGGPELPVTERLYIEALREQGRRGTATRLDDVFLMMEKQAIQDGEVIGEPPREKTVITAIPKSKDNE